MEQVRVMNRPEDYEAHGIDPTTVQQWEDGRRLDSKPGVMENWYFDAIMSNGTRAVVCFRPRSPKSMTAEGDSPNINIHITEADGTNFEQFINVPAEDCTLARDHCDVTFGPHRFTGDLTDYTIHVEPVDGIGCDLHFHRLVEPYRPGTGYVAFGNDESKHYTWLCFPKGSVTGTLTYNGATVEVSGNGYHDHQWHDTNPIMLIHHWLWGRQSDNDYTVAIIDIVASEAYGFAPASLFTVMGSDGSIVFHNEGDVTTDVIESYVEPTTNKRHPKQIRYTYRNSLGTAVYTVRQVEELEVRGASNIFLEKNPLVERKFAQMGLDPSYMRCQAIATLELDLADGTHVEQTGDMIYEFPYFGKTDPRAHLGEVE